MAADPENEPLLKKETSSSGAPLLRKETSIVDVVMCARVQLLRAWRRAGAQLPGKPVWEHGYARPAVS